MLAQEVRTGELSGICHFNVAQDGDSDAGSSGAPQAGSHCEMCGALGWALPPLAVCAIPCFAVQQVASVDVPAAVASAIPGLPFSCGPPAL